MRHGMHSGNPDRSKRLRMALDYLERCGLRGCTTAQLQGATGSMAPATDCSELRQSGHKIECKCLGSWQGRRIYQYVYRGQVTP
jgi:hypothetical protein